MIKKDFWRQDYRLDQMTLKTLWIAYFSHYTIMSYLLLAASSAWLAAVNYQSFFGIAAPAAAAVVIYPFAWYLLHRFVLHGAFLYRSKHMAKVWKRIHFDHHRDPHDLHVLFGALHTTLPTIALITMPVGWLLGGLPGLCAAFTAGLLATCFYEFCHCIQHLNYQPRWTFLSTMKRLHLRHHFHDETTNFGITNFVPDRLFGSYAPRPKNRPRSESVFNLGYTRDQVRQYPWVARLSPDIDEQQAIDQGIERKKPQSVQSGS